MTSGGRPGMLRSGGRIGARPRPVWRAGRPDRCLGCALIACLTAMLALAAGALATDWPQFGFSARHSSLNSAETVLGPSNVRQLALAHHTDLSSGIAVTTAPIVAGSRV